MIINEENYKLYQGNCLDINTNRNFIGIELDENYFNIAKKRIEGMVIKWKMNAIALKEDK